MKKNNIHTIHARNAIRNLKVYDHHSVGLKAAAIASPTAAKRLATAARNAGLSPQRILNGFNVLEALAYGLEVREITSPELVAWEISKEFHAKQNWL
jgi:hypothetical protein